MQFEQMLARVLRPEPILEALPKGRRKALLAFAKRRKPFYMEGVFVESGHREGGSDLDEL
jgi:hypothetical protein